MSINYTEHEILFANDRFYSAFNSTNIKLMDQIWGEENTSCIHPNSYPIYARDEIIYSFQEIFNSPHPPMIQCIKPKVRFYGKNALVICIEKIKNNFLFASNIYFLNKKNWLIVHHHASVTNIPSIRFKDESQKIIN